MTSFAIPSDAAAAASSLRERQKAATRARVVEAARALFKEKGYADSTIRDIAARAEVAPGSVFTTFASKAELLQEIIFARYDALFAAVGDAVAIPGDPAERLTAFAHAAFAAELSELRLVAENVGASWTWTLDAELENRVRLAPLLVIIGRVLAEGKAAGCIAADAPTPIVVDAIFSCYLRVFRKALFDGWEAAQCGDYLGAQIRLILNGCR